MRYVVQEPVLTTITDDEISDEKDVKDLLQKLKDMQHSIHLSYEDPDTYFIRSLDSVRIINISENAIDIHAFLNSATVKYRDIPIVNIKKIRVVSTKQEMSQRYKVTRFQMMEVAEISEL